jgi:hypothetical protein
MFLHTANKTIVAITTPAILIAHIQLGFILTRGGKQANVS